MAQVPCPVSFKGNPPVHSKLAKQNIKDSEGIEKYEPSPKQSAYLVLVRDIQAKLTLDMMRRAPLPVPADTKLTIDIIQCWLVRRRIVGIELSAFKLDHRNEWHSEIQSGIVNISTFEIANQLLQTGARVLP